MKPVAALFVRADSTYKQMAGVDCYDIGRDARRWPGGCPVVAHPPCRAWATFSPVAKPREGERDLALWALEQVRRFGGVLEHPRGSALWREAALPAPGQVDKFGGWTLPISQHWFGHRAEKLTRLYIVGVVARNVPDMPMKLGEATHVIAQNRAPGRGIDGQRLRKGMPGWRPEVTPREREHTPPALAAWLVELARRCAVAERIAA